MEVSGLEDVTVLLLLLWTWSIQKEPHHDNKLNVVQDIN